MNGLRTRLFRTLTTVILGGLIIAHGALAHAENHVVENLGGVERQARVLGYAVSPGTDRYPARLLISFAGEDGTWILNLRDGSSRQVKSPGLDNDYFQWPSFIGADGRVFTSCGRGGLSIYDPVGDTIKVVRPIPQSRWLRGMAIGPGGGVYISDYPTGAAAVYDPKTGKVRRFGRQGGPFTISHVYGYSVGFDGRYVYTAVGKIPWFVVAYDTATGEQKNLFRFPSSDHPEVHQRGDQVFLEVKHGSPNAGEPTTARFQLIEGRAKSVESIPRFDDSYVPGHDLPQPQFEPLGRSLPIEDSQARIKYRMPGENWKTAVLPLAGTDMVVERITPSPDGRLLLSTGPYGNVHRFDPESSSITRLGNPASKHVYDMLQVDDRVYFCGYPNSVLGSFGGEGGAIIGDWHESLGSKHAIFLVKGADGRIYSGNHNERASTGGALGWYDPSSGEFGGIHFPNDDCEYLTTARDGRFIVYASDFSLDPTHPEIKPRDGRLLVYDTLKRQLVRQISPLQDGSSGVVVETAPGVLFGIGRHDKLPMMYTVDLASGAVTRREPLSARAKRLIALGPDGNVYTFIDGTLVRIEPTTFQEQTLLRTEPGRMAFVGNDLYIAGTSQLRRVKNAAAEE